MQRAVAHAKHIMRKKKFRAYPTERVNRSCSIASINCSTASNPIATSCAAGLFTSVIVKYVAAARLAPLMAILIRAGRSARPHAVTLAFDQAGAAWPGRGLCLLDHLVQYRSGFTGAGNVFFIGNCAMKLRKVPAAGIGRSSDSRNQGTHSRSPDRRSHRRAASETALYRRRGHRTWFQPVRRDRTPDLPDLLPFPRAGPG